VFVGAVSRILFAHGHILRHDAKQFAIGKPYPPLATLLAAGYVRARGHEAALYDPMLEVGVSGFARAIEHARPDVVVLYDDSFNWFTKMCLSRMREVAIEMVRAARARGLPVVVAGHDVADDPEPYLRAGATFILAGEGEATLGELLARLEEAGGDADALRRDGAASIRGLVFRDRGLLRRTPARELLRDLDVLPPAAWDLVEMDQYRAAWKRRHGYFSLNVVTTRGCPYLCNWCAKPVYGNTYHSRSPGNVVAEMRALRERYAPDHFWFCDDILGLKSRWLVAWADAVAAAGVTTPFLCQTRADLMTEDNVGALRRAGAREVWLGVESGSQRILDAMQKGITVDQARAAASRLRSQGIRVGFFLQFGYAGEGWAEIQATRSLVREVVPDDIGISVSYPLPGTGYYDRVVGALGKKHNWTESNDLDPLIPGRFSARFYRTLSRVVHAELRVARGARALRRIVRERPRTDGTAVDLDALRHVAGLRYAASWVVARLRLELEVARRRGAALTIRAASRIRDHIQGRGSSHDPHP
jgi:anaerobic magnesium-protoporphyrin IX monomethyl ester cyclase